MTVDRQKGEIIFECDDCGETIAFRNDVGFEAALALAKEDGWEPVKAGNGWEHRCPGG